MAAKGSRLAVVGALWALAGLVSAQAPGAVTTSLTVKGSVEREITLPVEDLKRLPVQRMDDVRSLRDSTAGATSSETVRRYGGCFLRDVLDRAKPVEKKRMDFRRSVVIATASDGYRAVFSWAELYLSPLGEGVLVDSTSAMARRSTTTKAASPSYRSRIRAPVRAT